MLNLKSCNMHLVWYLNANDYVLIIKYLISDHQKCALFCTRNDTKLLIFCFRGFLQNVANSCRLNQHCFRLLVISLSSDPHPSRWVISPNRTPTFPPSVCPVTSTLPPIFGLNSRFPTEVLAKAHIPVAEFSTADPNFYSLINRLFKPHYTTICLDWIWIFT